MKISIDPTEEIDYDNFLFGLSEAQAIEFIKHLDTRYSTVGFTTGVIFALCESLEDEFELKQGTLSKSLSSNMHKL